MKRYQFHAAVGLGATMRPRPSLQTLVKTWCYRPVVYVVLLGFFALAAAAASSERSHSNRSAVISGMANAHSGAGNLIPVW
jgi:predicted aminopeptidase